MRLDHYKKRFENGELPADIMTDMEREFGIPMVNNEVYNKNNPDVIEVYREIGNSRDI